MAAAVAAEGAVYRPNAPVGLVLVASSLPALVLPAAVAFDLARLLAGRRWTAAAAAAVALGGAALDRTWATIMAARFYPGLDAGAALLGAAPLVALAALVGVGAALVVARALVGAHPDRPRGRADARLAEARLLAGVLAVGATAVGVGVASAHGEEPLNTLTLRAGPYPLVVEYFDEPRGGQELRFAIRPAQAGGRLRYLVSAVPGMRVEAVPVRAALTADPDEPAGVHGRVALPVSGEWLLAVEVEGPLGPGSRDVPIVAGAPPAIPVEAGWAVGLLPLATTTALVVAWSRRETAAAAESPA
jgi:hypothetical protein